MAIGDHFIHTCTIERSSGSTVDAYGNASNYFQIVASGEPCRLVEQEQTVRSDEQVESLAVTKYKLMLGAGTDVQERDRVTVDGRSFVITGVLKRNARGPHHVTVKLERAS
jgi:hypothetical protein